MADVPALPPGFQLEGSAPPPPTGFVVQKASGADPGQVAAASKLYHESIATGNDVAASHAKAWLDAHGVAPTAPDAETQAKIADITATRAASNPAIGNGVGGSLLGTALGAIHHAANIPLGAAQLATNVAGKVGDAVGSDALDSVAQRMNQYMQKRDADYQDATQGNVGSYVGATAGEIAPWLVGLGELRAAGMLPTATTTFGKLRALAGEGAVIGATQPVTEGSYFPKKAKTVVIDALAGPALSLGGQAVAAGARGIRDTARLATGSGRDALANDRLAKILTSISPEMDGVTDLRPTLQALQTAAPLVPGETVGAAQAIGGPRAAQMGRMLANDPNAGPVLADAGNANNAARFKVLQDIAGTPEAMTTARQARTDATQPYIQQHLTPQTPMVRWTEAAKPFDAALNAGGRMLGADRGALQQARQVVAQVRGGTMQEDDALAALREIEPTVSSQAAQSAFQTALDAVNNNMVNPAKLLNRIATMRNTGPGARASVRQALDKIAQTITESRNTLGMVPMDVLDSVRQNIGDFLVSPTGRRATAQESALLDPIRHQIIDTLQQRAPGYSDYLANYARLSQPINTMERVGRLVDQNSTGGRDSAGGKVLTAAALKQFLRQDDAARFKISPQARAQIEALRDSAARDDLQNVKIGTKGSDTAALLQLPSLTGSLNPFKLRMLGALAGGALEHAAGIPMGYLGGAATGLLGGNALVPVLERANADIVRRIGAKASDAATAESILRAANPKPTKLSELGSLILPYKAQPKVLTSP